MATQIRAYMMMTVTVKPAVVVILYMGRQKCSYLHHQDECQ